MARWMLAFEYENGEEWGFIAAQSDPDYWWNFFTFDSFEMATKEAKRWEDLSACLVCIPVRFI